MCTACRPRRRAALEAVRERTRRRKEPHIETTVLTDCLEAIDKLAMLAPPRLTSGTKGDDVVWQGLEDVFMATKEVIVNAEALVEFGIATR
jgi:hypothetical protein